MKLLNGFLLPALAAAAADQQQQPLEAYILRQSTPSNPSHASPSLPNDLAQAILLQRLSTPDHPTKLGPLSDAISQDDAVSYISQFGKPSPPLFHQTTPEPKQLVLAFTGVSPSQYNDLKSAVPKSSASFTSAPLAAAFRPEPKSCAFDKAIDPAAAQCWSSTSKYIQFDATKDKSVLKQFSSKISTLRTLANKGEMETTILFLAPSTAAPGTEQMEELRRRQQREVVMTEHSGETYTPSIDKDATAATGVSSSASSSPSTTGKPSFPVPACFSSKDACEQGTASCSGHGKCGDKFAATGGSEACFVCKCHATEEPYSSNPGSAKSIFRWGGGACEKIDVSTPFWLFAGVTIALVATVAFSINLLFSVGEEKLPGVIGAGVSRSK